MNIMILLKHYKMQKEFLPVGEYFLLVTQLYKNNLLSTINQVVKQGTPYLGPWKCNMRFKHAKHQ
jgi:peptidase E